jgi:predicted MFS family arabinose efflux permease
LSTCGLSLASVLGTAYSARLPTEHSSGAACALSICGLSLAVVFGIAIP